MNVVAIWMRMRRHQNTAYNFRHVFSLPHLSHTHTHTNNRRTNIAYAAAAKRKSDFLFCGTTHKRECVALCGPRQSRLYDEKLSRVNFYFSFAISCTEEVLQRTSSQPVRLFFVNVNNNYFFRCPLSVPVPVLSPLMVVYIFI